MRKFYTISFCLYLSYIIFVTSTLHAQDNSGILKGIVFDGTTNKPLYNVSLKLNNVSAVASSFSNGYYYFQLAAGSYTLNFSLPGFQSKTVAAIPIKTNETTILNILIYPLTKNSFTKKILNDSVNHDSTKYIQYNDEAKLNQYNFLKFKGGVSDVINEEDIEPRLEQNGSHLTKFLSGVIVRNDPFTQNGQTIDINGLDERYNQVFLNGTLINSFSAINRSYPLSLIPVEAIEKVKVLNSGNTFIPGDFAGGNLEIKLKDFTAKNFFYLQAGSGFSDNTSGKKFLEDERSNREFFSFPGSIRNLPAGFPTTKSKTSFSNETPEQQVQLSMKLKNNLVPVDYGSAEPDDKILIGFGRIINLKDNKKIGVVSYFQQAKSKTINNSMTEVLPDVVNNPYPFNNNTRLINAYSYNNNYIYNSLFSGILNASYIYNRNRFSFTNFLGSTFNNLYTNRTQVYKPDEDTLAHDGIYYKSTHEVIFITQLAGEHALGNNGNFNLSWHASYNHVSIQNPDERSFSLKQDSADATKFQIARVSAPPLNTDPNSANPAAYDPNLTNSGRLWRNLSEDGFEGAVNISTPFNLFHQSQSLTGGIYVQGRYRIFNSNLLSVTDSGYYALNNLLAQQNYQSGSLVVKNYYINEASAFPNGRANYNASSNIGASYIKFENKLLKDLSVEWGIRLEAASQLVSNIAYSYPTCSVTVTPIDKNNFVTTVDFLPSVEVKYFLLNSIELKAGYFKTLNRPQLQELTSYRYYDPLAFNVLIGNPVLERALIQNYNAGISWIPKSESSISVYGFYKRIDQPIENLISGYTSASVIMQPVNMPSTNIYGITANFKLSLKNIVDAATLSNLYVFGNGNFLHTKVEQGYVRYYENYIPEHTLSGSPKYSFNAGLMFKKDGFPALSLVCSGYGDYIYAVGYGANIKLNNGLSVSSIPDYRVKASQQLDAQIGQKILKARLQIIAGVKNILDSKHIIYQDLNGNKKFDVPLRLQAVNNMNSYYLNGTDNTITDIKSQRTFYFTVSYIF